MRVLYKEFRKRTAGANTGFFAGMKNPYSKQIEDKEDERPNRPKAPVSFFPLRFFLYALF